MNSNVKVFLDNLLIFDSLNLQGTNNKDNPNIKISPITGLAIGSGEGNEIIPSEQTEENQNSQELYSETPVEEVQNENPLQEDLNPSPETFESPQQSEEQTIEELNNETSNSEILENALQEEPLSNQSIENETVVNETRDNEGLTNKSIGMVVEFKNVCEETCDLSNVNLDKLNFLLNVELKNAKLNLDSITYEIISFGEIITNVTSIDYNFTNFTFEGAVQGDAELNKPVRWRHQLKARDLDEIQSELPNEFYLLSGEEIEKEVFNVTYETPAPIITEETELEGRGKQIKVKGSENPNLHYTNVLVYTNLSEDLAITNPDKVKILWVEKQEYIPYSGIADFDKDGIFDYIEFIAPELSEQTFEIIIEISKAEHLDNNKNFISDIYNEVYQLDGLWSEPINANEYVRIQFKQNLTKEKDITLYPRVVSGNPVIEVYEVNENNIIAQFNNLNNNEYNKVYLTNLESESQDTFDLRVVGGSIELDYIFDPPTLVQYYFTGGNTIGAGGIGELSLSTGGATATWTTTANGQQHIWIKQYLEQTNFPSQTYIVGFWCSATSTAGGDRVDVDNLGILDCGTSSDCSSVDATICSTTGANIACDQTAVEWRTITCASGSTSTLQANDYLGVRLTADINDAKAPDLIFHFNSTTRNTHFNVTEEVVVTDETYPTFANFLEFRANNSEYHEGITMFNTTLTNTNGTVYLTFDGVNYTARNTTDGVGNVFNVSINNIGVGTFPFYWGGYGNGTGKNSNATALRSYVVTINTTANVIVPYLNGVDSNLVVNYPQQINASFASSTNRTLTSAAINGTAITLHAATTWGAGGWTVNFSMSSNQNYTAFQALRNLTINRAGGLVTLLVNHTTANATISQGNSVWLNATLTNGDPTKEIYLYNAGTLINNGTSPIANLTTFSSEGSFNISAFYPGSQNYSENWSSSYFVDVGVPSNVAPQIIKVSGLDAVTLNEGGNKNVTINFTVEDTNGVGDLVNSSANANFTFLGEGIRANSTCYQYQAGETNANYTCSMMMWWFDIDGIWGVNVTIADSSNAIADNDTNTITVNPLTGFSATPGNVSFSSLNPGSFNQTALEFLILNNTGNQNIANGSIQVNSTTLYGENNNALALHSGNFTMSNNTGAGNPQCDLSGASASRMALVSGSAFTFVNGANMSRGNYTKQDGRGQEQLYLCLTLVGSELSQQSYSTAEAGAWIVKIS